MMRMMADMIAFGKQYTRSTVTMFFAFVFPILLILIFGAIFTNMGSQKIELSVQDLDQGQFSEMYISFLENTTLFTIKDIPFDEDIESYISNNSLTVAVYIPPDFSARIAGLIATNGSGVSNVTLYGDPTQSTYSTVLTGLIVVQDQMSYTIAEARPLVGFVTENPGGDNFTFMDFFVPGIVGMTVMINAMYTMTSICAEYKSRGYFKLLATTTLKKTDWLLSKFAFYSVMLILSLLLTFAVGNLAFGMNAALTPMAFVFIVAGAFLFTSLGMLLGILAKDPEAGSAISNAIGFPMMFLSGTFFALETMPSYIQVISMVLPLTYLNEGLRDAMVYESMESALVNLAVVIVLGIVFFVAASRLMSWKER